jgi:ABC-type branched-subunit amino acid transport system ATPase component/ABC-type branched-subunit amino acid transport system permease subunit
VGLNILIGLSGQISIGHAGFFAIGAYTSALLTTEANWSFWSALAITTFSAAFIGVALALPALRVSGPYLAMVTIAFGIVVERIAIEWSDVTGGFGGIFNIPKPSLLGSESLRGVALLAIVAAGLSLASFSALKHHAWGRAFQAVRDDSIAAASVGLNVLTVRAAAFAVSAAFTGIAGAFFAAAVSFISPDSFTVQRSIIFLLVVLIGGAGTVEGAAIGALILVVLPELLQDYADYQPLLFGLLLLLTLWLAPGGVAQSGFRRWRRQTPEFPPPGLTAIPAIALQGSQQSSLAIEAVSVQIGGIRALNGVSLVASGGTINAIIGPNGAGKTTLLNAISGLCKPQTGRIQLNNREVTGWTSDRIARAGIARTFQSTRLFNSLSVFDNLRVARQSNRLGNIFSAMLGLGRDRSSEPQLLELLTFVGYEGDIHQLAQTLPFAQRRLVELARTLATSPSLLLLDEPAAGLSQPDRDCLSRLIRQLADAGLNSITIEHDMNVVMDVSDRILVLDSGTPICSGPPTLVQHDRRTIDAYLGVSSTDLSRTTPVSDRRLLHVDRLNAGYGSLKVLHDISFEVNQGELVAVIGPNGAGKTTLMSSICQIVKPHSGRLTFGDVNLRQYASHAMPGLGVVLVPEGRQVFATLSVLTNLRLGAFHRQDSEIDSDIESMLTRFPRLRERQHQLAGSLSGGEQQMLAIARGLMARPQLLLLDEPSLGLAPQLVTSLYETLAGLRDEGTTILLVDGMASLAFSVADRAYLLETGCIVRAGTASELQADPVVAQAYLGRSPDSIA